MATKHNTEVNNDPLKREYFDDVLDLFYTINEKKHPISTLSTISFKLCAYGCKCYSWDNPFNKSYYS